MYLLSSILEPYFVYPLQYFTSKNADKYAEALPTLCKLFPEMSSAGLKGGRIRGTLPQGWSDWRDFASRVVGLEGLCLKGGRLCLKSGRIRGTPRTVHVKPVGSLF